MQFLKLLYERLSNACQSQRGSTELRRHNRLLRTHSFESLESRMLLTGDAFEVDDLATQASIIGTDGVTQEHSINVANDVDWLRFQVTESSKIIAETNGSSGDTVMWLYGPNSSSNQLKYDDDSGNGSFSRIEAYLDPGWFYIRIASYGQSNSIASYTAKVTSRPLIELADSFEDDNERSRATTIGSGDSQIHSFHDRSDQDWFRLVVAVPSAVSFESSVPYALSGTPEFDLFDPNGVAHLTDQTHSFSRNLWPGTYYLMAKERNGGILEQYTLGVSIAALPDLTTQNVSDAVSQNPGIGDEIVLRWAERNLGPGAVVNRSVPETVYISIDAQFDQGDTILGSSYSPYFTTFAAGTLVNRSTTVTLPQNLQWAGRSAYVIVRLDPNNYIAETNETNNTLVIPLEIRPYIQLDQPIAGQFVDRQTPIEVSWKAVDVSEVDTVRIVVDDDADPNNGGELRVLAQEHSTSTDITRTIQASLAGLSTRVLPYYLRLQLTQPDGQSQTRTVPIFMKDVAATSNDPLGDTVGGSNYEVWGIDASQVGDRIGFRVRSNYDPRKPYGDNFSGGGDLLFQVGSVRFGLAVNTHATSAGGKVVAGDLYADAEFLDGTTVSEVPTFIDRFSRRITGQSSVLFYGTPQASWKYEIVGYVTLAALNNLTRSPITLSWSMYCGNDTDDVTIQPINQSEDPRTPDLVAISVARASDTGSNPGGLEYHYRIASADLPHAPKIAVSWATGTSWDTRVGTQLLQDAPQSRMGDYGPITIQAIELPEQPDGARYLLIFMDTDSAISESDETNNIVSVEVEGDDPDDQLNEVVTAGNDLGELTTTRDRGGAITHRDVDMYSFTVIDGQRVAFDIDVNILGNVPMTLRVFNSSGAELAMNSSGPAPREDRTQEAYVEYFFPMAGTFYVGVSGVQNTAYDPKAGENDQDANESEYTLIVTPITRTLTPLTGRSTISGQIIMPNKLLHDERITTSLQRADSEGQPGTIIEGSKRTWIVIHGRTDDPEQFRPLAGALVRQTQGRRRSDQVLLLDWSQGAHDNPLILDGAEWIPYAADWAASVLRSLRLSGSELILVGHSWGSYMAYDIAKAFGTVRGIVAIDPAFAGVGFGSSQPIGYTSQRVNFQSVSTLSWAFYGSGPFGNANLAGTAHEAFTTAYFGGEPGAFAKHTAPIHIFEAIARDNKHTLRDIGGLFSLKRLISGRTSTQWRTNFYAAGSALEPQRQVFEGVFTVVGSTDPTRDGGYFWRIGAFRYYDARKYIERQFT